MSMMSSKRTGRATLAIVLVLTLSVLGIAAAWWSLTPRGSVTSYMKVPRQSHPFYSNDHSVSEEAFRTERNNHKSLLKSALVLDAALQQQDVANLDLVRRQANPLGWLSRSLIVTLPEDSEIIEVSLPCDSSDVRATQDAIRVVDEVVKTYFDKVLLQDRLRQASELADFKQALSELESQLPAKLEAMHKAQAGAQSAADKAKLQLLKDECVALRQLRTELKGKLLMAEFEQGIEARNEMTGGPTGRVEVLQRATVSEE